MDFTEYLLHKKIDSTTFQKANPVRFQEWEKVFMLMHPDSFTAQKKFLINETRRRYPLSEGL